MSNYRLFGVLRHYVFIQKSEEEVEIAKNDCSEKVIHYGFLWIPISILRNDS